MLNKFKNKIMKKITFFALAMISTCVVSAQSLTETAASENPSFERSTQDILWEQMVNGTDGIVSDVFDGLGSGVWSADDFELTEANKIETITTYGFQNLLSLESILLGYQLFIFTDDGFGRPEGSPITPGSGELELDIAYPDASITMVEDGSGGYAFTVDIEAALGEELVLPAGTYWVSAAPVLSMSSLDATERWNWYGGEPNLSEAVLIDPDDQFAGGFTDWTPFSTLGLAWGGLAFTIEGEESLSVADNLASQVSIFPVPATDVINVNTTNSIEVSSVALFDLLGRDTGAVFANGQVDISNLSKGVYLMTVETNEGSLTQKVVKK